MMNLDTGRHIISEDEYHQLTAFSNSDLKLIARSPAHYKASKTEQKEPTPALIAGRILHCAILEPENFHSRFVVVPEDAPRRPSSAQRDAKKPSEDTIRAILWWDEWNLQTKGKQEIKHEDQLEYTAIANNIRSHPELVGFLKDSLTEQTFIANDPVTGVQLRCRADLVCTINGYRVVIDFKSAEDARRGYFERACFNYGYFHQEAFYRDVIEWSGYGKVDLFLFAVFEKEAPYAVKLYQSTATAVDRARTSYRQSLNLAAECLANNEWPNYSTDIETLDYPAWAKD